MLISLIGIYMIIEAVASMFLLRNIGPMFWQVGRGVRIICGIILLVVGLVRSEND